MRSNLRLTKFLFKWTVLGFGSFYGYHFLHDLQKPKPYDFMANKGKPKDIVIVGSGMAGLLTAYYLSKHAHNHITVLERHSEPY